MTTSSVNTHPITSTEFHAALIKASVITEGEHTVGDPAAAHRRRVPPPRALLDRGVARGSRGARRTDKVDHAQASGLARAPLHHLGRGVDAVSRVRGGRVRHAKLEHPEMPMRCAVTAIMTFTPPLMIALGDTHLGDVVRDPRCFGDAMTVEASTQWYAKHLIVCRCHRSDHAPHIHARRPQTPVLLLARTRRELTERTPA